MSGYLWSKTRTIWSTDKRKTLGCLLTILLINWVANFWNISDFGLYIDDYSRIPQTMEIVQGKSSSIDLVSDIFSAPINIRPLHNYLIKFFTSIGTAIGGLVTIYSIGYLISSINAILFFILLNRIVPNLLFAFTGALAMCLYPVSSTKIWLTSLLGIQPGMTLLLAALLCYLANMKKRSYLIMAVSLFCYESYFPVFFAAPLLNPRWNRGLLKELLRHLWISAAIFVSFFLMRILSSDPRMDHLDHVSVIQAGVFNLMAGPWFNFKKHLSIPVRNLMDLPRDLVLLQMGVFVSLWLIYYKIYHWMQCHRPDSRKLLKAAPEAAAEICTGLVHRHHVSALPTYGVQFRIRTDDRPRVRDFIKAWATEIARLLRTPLISGMVMVILAYSLAFYGSVFHCHGITSRIHTAATPGMAMLIAAAAVGLLHLFSQKKLQIVAMGMLALIFSSCLTYNYRIQKSYVASRDIQRNFWTQVMKLCPDLTDESLVLVEASGLDQSNVIKSISWSTNRILEKIYKFPPNWRFLPRLYLVTEPEIRGSIQVRRLVTGYSLSELLQMGVIKSIAPADRYHRIVDPSKVIVLTTEGGTLYRHFSRENRVKGLSIKTNAIDPLQRFDHGILYDHLIEPPNTLNGSRLVQNRGDRKIIEQ